VEVELEIRAHFLRVYQDVQQGVKNGPEGRGGENCRRAQIWYVLQDMDLMNITEMTQVLFAALGRGLARGFLGELPAGSGPRPAAAGAPASSASSVPSGPFRAGDSVRYRQGRGTFFARVVSVDARAGKATVERSTDGKRVVRPFDKLLRS